MQSLLLYDIYFSDRYDGPQLELCADLSERAACFDAAIGPDVAELPRLLEEVMQRG